METSNTPTSPSSTTTISSSSVASNTVRTPPSPSSGSIGSRTRGWISSWHSETSISSRARIGQKMPDLLIDQSPSIVGAKRVWIGERDPIQIEKCNLVNILKLVIKEVLDSSLRFGHQLDSDHIPLQHFFIVLEHILKHGLKAPAKRLLGPRKELWDLLQLVEKKEFEAVDITASVRELPTVKSALGRARAWLRLALMQKKLADYFRHLLDQGDEVLSEFYEPRALLRSDEAAIVTGLLLSLNVVDCNLCVKEEDLESQQGVIDFSLYLRNNKEAGVTSPNDPASTVASNSTTDIAAVLDQKSYIEELNRHLNATVNSLQTKIEGLTTTNALMKEDLNICQNALFKTQEENKKLLSQMDGGGQTSTTNDGSSYSSTTDRKGIGLRRSGDSTSYLSSNSSSKNEEIEVKRKLIEEIKKGEEMQKELRLQKSMKAEMEVAMKLLEKDVNEKQLQIGSLRDQLEDIKSLNFEMYTKLQEKEKNIKCKSDLILKLQGKYSAILQASKELDNKFSKCEVEKKEAISSVASLREDILAKENRLAKVEADLKQLQKKSDLDKETLYKAREETNYWQKVGQKHEEICSENEELRAKINERDQTLKDMANWTSQLTSELEEVKEITHKNHGGGPGIWKNDADVHHCPICEKEFTISRRKHHCRHCGGIFCDDCCGTKLALASSKNPERVCDNCYHLLLNQHAKIQ